MFTGYEYLQKRIDITRQVRINKGKDKKIIPHLKNFQNENFEENIKCFELSYTGCNHSFLSERLILKILICKLTVITLRNNENTWTIY